MDNRWKKVALIQEKVNIDTNFEKLIKPGALERSDCLSNWMRVRAKCVNTLDFN